MAATNGNHIREPKVRVRGTVEEGRGNENGRQKR
jgi:hypothetical protein